MSTFYVLDFDECIGNVPASYQRLLAVLERHGYDVAAFDTARKQADMQLVQFAMVDYLEQTRTDVVIDQLFNEYIASIDDPETIREEGATMALAWLERTGRPHGIVSFGDPAWQHAKIKAAGLSAIGTRIIDRPGKSEEVLSWRQADGRFRLPNELAESGPAVYDEIVIVDDKAAAFKALTGANQQAEGIRGYWLQLREHLNFSQKGDVDPQSVRTITSWQEFITGESRY